MLHLHRSFLCALPFMSLRQHSRVRCVRICRPGTEYRRGDQACPVPHAPPRPRRHLHHGTSRVMVRASARRRARGAPRPHLCRRGLGSYRGVAAHKGRDFSWDGIQDSLRVTGPLLARKTRQRENTDSGDSVSTAKRTQRVVSTLAQRKITPRTDQPILIVHIKN